MQVKKAVFPIAGLGTRLLPATKVHPKELLPIVDKPLIQYAVEEAMYAGITEMIFVSNSSNPKVANYFNPDIELERYLEITGKHELLSAVKEILPKGISMTYVHQPEPLGLGDAILCAREAVGNEPFVVILPDVLLDKEYAFNCVHLLCKQYEAHGHSTIAVQEVPHEEIQRYGVVELKSGIAPWSSIQSILEKPTLQETSSNLIVLGRYLFTPALFPFLSDVVKDRHGEIQLTDGIAKLLQHEPVYVHQYDGQGYDCGSKLGYLKAMVAYGKRHPDVGKLFEQYLKTVAME